MPHLTPFSLLTLAILATPALAQSPHRTEPVVVTATRTSQPLEHSISAVDVIDRDAINASASQDVVELLRRVPGVDVVRGGGLGQQTSVFIRGTNSNHALVMIDGIRVSALGTGSYAWEHLPIAQIERIEIVRGPRASLWGADALGGVIQIFTRQSNQPYAALTIGNHDTYGLTTGIGQRGDNGGIGITAGWLESRGQNATRPDNFSFDPDRDGVVLRNIAVHGDIQLGTQQLAARTQHLDNDVDFDQGESQTKQDIHTVTLSGELGQDWNHQLTLGASRDRLETPAFFSIYRSRRQQADWVNTLSLSTASQLTLGASWLNERGSQIDTFSQIASYHQSRHSRSLFAGWQHQVNAQAFEFSGRYDDNSVYGSQSSFAAGWSSNISDNARLFATWGQGFRAPTMNELYSPGFGGWYTGNADLTPERSRSSELGLRITPDSENTFELRAFRNDIHDLIDFSGAQAQAINIARARMTGTELRWQWQGERWSLDTNATWQRPKNQDTGDTLLRRPKHKLTALLERRFANDLRLGVEGIAATERQDFGGVTLGGYGTLALRANLPLSAAWSIDARIENLLNRDYTLVDGYHTPGSTALLTLRWNDAR